MCLIETHYERLGVAAAYSERRQCTIIVNLHRTTDFATKCHGGFRLKISDFDCCCRLNAMQGRAAARSVKSARETGWTREFTSCKSKPESTSLV